MVWATIGKWPSGLIHLASEMKELKAYISSNYPAFFSVLRDTRQACRGIAEKKHAAKKWVVRLWVRYQPRRVFLDIYSKNSWGGAESRSGSGSSLEQTKTIREQLPTIVAKFGVKSFLDIPCGDFYWMKQVRLDVDEYIGADIIGPLVERNRSLHTTKNRKFTVLDIMKDPLPAVDLIFSRDCLVHFSYRDICRTIRNIKRSNARYLLTTTFTAQDQNTDIATGEWRPLNLQLPPFNFPDPIVVINENCTELGGRYPDKSLGLWQIAKIP
jgi:SAM-dependent methyltransferase